MWTGLAQLTQALQEQAEGIARQTGLDEQLVSGYIAGYLTGGEGVRSWPGFWAGFCFSLKGRS
jgi:hypothetical protein